MTNLRHDMPVEQFAVSLRGLQRSWRRTLGRSVAGRRRYRDLTVSRLRWFRSHNGAVVLPFPARAAEEPVWTAPEADEVKIVFYPPRTGEIGPTRTATARAARKRLAQSFHGLRDLEEGSQVELVSSRRAVRSQVPTPAEAYSRAVTRKRALYLEVLGVAIVPSLTAKERAALEEAGAVVLDNTDAAHTQAANASARSVDKADLATRCWHLPAVNVDAARKRQLFGKGATIGIADSGIDVDHREFRERKNDISFLAFAPDGSPMPNVPAKDYGSHGTHIASICAGKNVGIAPMAKLKVAATTTKPNGRGAMTGRTAQLLGGVNWLLLGNKSHENGVDILNISLSLNKYEDEVLDVFQSAREDRGILTVASIGNGGMKNVSYPARFGFVMGVGATDRTDRIATFSGWNTAFESPAPKSPNHKPDLVTYGVDVVGAVPTGDQYRMADGCSVSTAIVSGVGALLLAAEVRLKADPSMLAARIRSLTVAAPQATGVEMHRVGCGRIDLTMI